MFIVVPTQEHFEQHKDKIQFVNTLEEAKERIKGSKISFGLDVNIYKLVELPNEAEAEIIAEETSSVSKTTKKKTTKK